MLEDKRLVGTLSPVDSRLRNWLGRSRGVSVRHGQTGRAGANKRIVAIDCVRRSCYSKILFEEALGWTHL